MIAEKRSMRSGFQSLQCIHVQLHEQRRFFASIVANRNRCTAPSCAEGSPGLKSIVVGGVSIGTAGVGLQKSLLVDVVGLDFLDGSISLDR